MGSNIQVLQVAAGKVAVGNNDNLAVALLGDDNLVAEVADAALNLDALVQKLLERIDVEDLVLSRGAAVDDKLLAGLALGGGLLRPELEPIAARQFLVSFHLGGRTD